MNLKSCGCWYAMIDDALHLTVCPRHDQHDLEIEARVAYGDNVAPIRR